MDDGEASEVEEALIPGVLSPNPCTKVKMVAPTQYFTGTIGVPVLLTGAAECPPGQTPEYQYWSKRFRDPNWTPLGFPGSYVPGSSSWVPPTGEHWCVTVVVRVMGAPEDYQARANARCTAPRCGDGDVEAGEQCDDGNTVNGDGCENDCVLSTCGNGIVDAGEQCDDGNTVNGDGCENNCTLPACGNGIVEDGEQCDDGNASNGDGCENDCTLPTCCNGIVDAGEQCDDGNTSNGDSCENDCTLPVCGNGIVDVGEQCDDGNASNGDGCENDCTITGTGPVYVKASNTGIGDSFGYSIALSADGSTLAVGVPFEDSAATDIGGDQADNSAPSAGAVYVFTRSGTAWSQQAYVKASNTGAGDGFGYSVALSSDGSTLAVGAPGEASASTGIDGTQGDNSDPSAGAVYVFTRGGTTWSQQAYVKTSNTGTGDNLGYSVAVSSDGSTLAVGAPGEDSAATGIGGNQADNSTLDSGAIYMFTRSGTTWSQQAYVKASNTGVGDNFGYVVAMSEDASTMAVGTPGEDSAATGIGGDEGDNSASGAGAVYVFTCNGATWSQQAYVKASNTDPGDNFGLKIALSANGTTLAVGAPGERSAASGIDGDQTNNIATLAGAVYVFAGNGTTWSQQAYVKASNPNASDYFGYGVALSADGSSLAVGAPGEASAATGIGGDQDDNSVLFAGAVYKFTRAGTTWSQAAYIKASNTDANDDFGYSVALSADATTLAVAAPGEASAATGIGGNQADNSAQNAGAVYVFP